MWYLKPGIWHGVFCTWYLEYANLASAWVGGGCFALDTYNLAPGIWHVFGICQLGTSLSWRRLLWHHLAFPVAAACTCLIAANWRGIARILLHRLLCIITLRGIARILLQIGRCALRGGEHQLCAVVASFVLVQQCTMWPQLLHAALNICFFLLAP